MALLTAEEIKIECVLCETPYTSTDLRDGLCPYCVGLVPPEPEGPDPTNDELNAALGTEGGFDADYDSQP